MMSFKGFRRNLITSLVIIFVCSSLLAAPKVSLKDDKISISVKDESLSSVLYSISQATGIEIYIAEDVPLKPISIDLSNMPIEEAFKRILKGYNYATVHERYKGGWKVSAINVYGSSLEKGKMQKVVDSSKLLESKEGGDLVKVVTYGSIGDGGKVLVPVRMKVAGSGGSKGEPSSEGLDPRLLQLQTEFEERELNTFNELLLITSKLENAKDPDERKALSLQYASKAGDFYELKKAHLNKVESLKRILKTRREKQ